MADILIRGMDMRITNLSCPFRADDGFGSCYCVAGADYCNAPFAERGADCPVSVLPEGHGRLIDAEELRKAMYHEAFETDSHMQKWESGCWIRYRMFERNLETVPTIVPAEGGTDNG